MKIKDIAHRDVATISPESTLLEAARKMRAYDVGSLPVCHSDRLFGIVTDRDLALRGTAEGRDPRAARVRDVMSYEVHTCLESLEVRDAMNLMLEHRVRRVVVVNEHKKPVGVISLRDLALVPGCETFAGEIYAALAHQPAGRH
jgi:CBS domain-containing protein